MRSDHHAGVTIRGGLWNQSMSAIARLLSNNGFLSRRLRIRKSNTVLKKNQLNFFKLWLPNGALSIAKSA
jgi:hypothetical protein